MRLVLQRVTQARVTINGELRGEIGPGLLALVGIGHGDTTDDLDLAIDKMINLRIFEDADGKMNLSLLDTRGAVLAISQFTLYANCRKGRRPSFTEAAPPTEARALFEDFLTRLRRAVPHVETGEFGAMMDITLTNAGPVTILLDTADLRSSRNL